jgi:hypothetical protein
MPDALEIALALIEQPVLNVDGAGALLTDGSEQRTFECAIRSRPGRLPIP